MRANLFITKSTILRKWFETGLLTGSGFRRVSAPQKLYVDLHGIDIDYPCVLFLVRNRSLNEINMKVTDK